jgi:hypothetical protein
MAKTKTPPGEADKPETPSAATDGQPDDLEKRRRSRNGTSLAERVENGTEDGELGDGEQAEAFPLGTLEGDPKVTIKNLITAGSKVTTEVAMSRAGVPNPSGGLFRPDTEVEVLVRVLPGASKATPIHEKQADGTYKIKEWKISQDLAVIHVQHAGDMFTREQVVEMLEGTGATAAVIARLLGEPAAAAQG